MSIRLKDDTEEPQRPWVVADATDRDRKWWDPDQAGGVPWSVVVRLARNRAVSVLSGPPAREYLDQTIAAAVNPPAKPGKGQLRPIPPPVIDDGDEPDFDDVVAQLGTSDTSDDENSDNVAPEWLNVPTPTLLVHLSWITEELQRRLGYW